eukprot:scpid96393/ scgid29919/ 
MAEAKTTQYATVYSQCSSRRDCLNVVVVRRPKSHKLESRISIEEDIKPVELKADSPLRDVELISDEPADEWCFFKERPVVYGDGHKATRKAKPRRILARQM